MRALLVLLSMAGCVHAAPTNSTAPIDVPVTTPASALEVRDVTAAELKAAWSQAPATVVHVWATWCDPCVEEFPAIVRAWRAVAPSGAVFQIVSADFAAQRDEARAFLSKQGVEGVTYRKAEEDQVFINAIDPRWSGTLPATFVIDPGGAIRFFREGQTSEAELVDAVRRVACDPTNPVPPRSPCEPPPSSSPPSPSR